MSKLEEFIKSKTGEVNSFDRSEVEFWLRAFVEKVRERAKRPELNCEPEQRGRDIGIERAFNEVVAELLEEEPKP